MIEGIASPSPLKQDSSANLNGLVSKIKYKGICVDQLKFENQTSETVVSPGAKIYGRLNFNIQPQGHHHCLRQILIGIKGQGPQHFILSQRKVIGKRLEGLMGVDQFQRVYENYSDYPKDFTLMAPTKMGLYDVEVCLLELEGEPIENAGTIQGFFKLKSQDQKIFQSPDALERLWNMTDVNCRVSMGRIRVI